MIPVGIAGTDSPALYQTNRWGVFSYQFAVPNGTYTVTLKFAETYFNSPGSRIFNVAINGTPVLTNFDIVAQGGPYTAIDKSFPVTVTNGVVSVQFLPGAADMPLVSAIAIGGSGASATSTSTSSASGTPLLRLNAGGTGFTDALGNTWTGDFGFSGGNTSITDAYISGTTAPALYQTNRWGAFTYQFNAPNGNYTVNLKFAETFFSTPGSRVFNVAINGAPVLTNFDIVAQGAPLTAIDRSFPVSVNDGQITVQLIPGWADQPLISGIEILRQ
jgi:hypothetical protein